MQGKIAGRLDVVRRIETIVRISDDANSGATIEHRILFV
jgi:hypothetical protein